MPPDTSPRVRPVPPAGLCDSCRHQRTVRTTRGSAFSLCARSRVEPQYPRYPPLPVLRCPGHETRPPGSLPPAATGAGA